MNRHAFTTNSPRKRWVGEARSVITVSKVGVVGMPRALEECEKSLKLQGERFGYTPDLTELLVENKGHQLIFKADYYTFK